MNNFTNSAQYRPVKMNTLGKTLGRPLGVPKRSCGALPIIKQATPPPLEMPGQGLERAINYYADYAGCGWWRMIAPEMLLNINNKAVVTGLTTMVLDPRFYNGIKAIRLQRQATPVQLQFLKFLKEGAKQHNFKIIYEIDDVIIRDDIPNYNRCKTAFESDEIMNSCLEMMSMSDEISVTCQYMKDYYMSKTGNKNITVVPNYPAKMWLDNHYDPNLLQKTYQKNKKRPRVAYIGSGTHIDVMNKNNQKDDFSHIVDSIIATRKDIHWIFIGCYPLACKPSIDSGEMTFIPWYPLTELWKAYATNDIQAVIAPLQDNIFNRSKSNIKYLEAATCGVPGVFQDMVTYKDAPLRFKTGPELIDQIKKLTKSTDVYMKYAKKARAYADTMWLDDHLDEFVELYYTNIGDGKRDKLLRLNPET